MSTASDQYLVDYEEIMDMVSELRDTPFPAVEAEVLNTSRPGVEPTSEQNRFTTSAQFEQSTPVGAVVVLSDGAYQKTARNRWRCLRPGRRTALYLMTLDLIAVLLRSGRRDIVIVPPLPQPNDLTLTNKVH